MSCVMSVACRTAFGFNLSLFSDAWLSVQNPKHQGLPGGRLHPSHRLRLPDQWSMLAPGPTTSFPNYHTKCSNIQEM